MTTLEQSKPADEARDSQAAERGCVVLQRLVSGRRVLDVCCGTRMMWFDKQDSRAVFVDKRSESFRPTAGKSYLCRRGCKEHGTVTGKVYVFDGSNLKHYSSRNVTMLLNGYNTLRQPYAFEETEAVAEPANRRAKRSGGQEALNLRRRSPAAFASAIG